MDISKSIFKIIFLQFIVSFDNLIIISGLLKPDNIFQILHSSLQGCHADVDIKLRQTFPVSNECAEPIFFY